MTSRELVNGLQKQLFNLFGEIIYDIDTVDLLYYLNKAQTQLIKEKVQVFEETQYITDELRTLVKDSVITPTANTKGYETLLPSDYNILVKHECTTLSTTGCGTKTVAGILVQLDDVGSLLKDPFWTPINEEPLYYIINTKIFYEIPKSDFTITSSKLTYIKKESVIALANINNSIDVTSDLPEFIHEEIINLARQLIIADKQLNIKN